MRISGWLIGLGIVGIFVATTVCSVLAFTFTRQFVVENNNALPLPRIDEVFAARPATDIPPTAIAQAAIAVSAADVPATELPADSAVPAVAEPTRAPTTEADPLAQFALDDPRKITVLLLGIDQRSLVEADERFFRTDTIIVVQIDPARGTAGMLSIPRDLWVDIPGFTTARINTANSLGDANAYPGGGPALVAETIRQNLGVRVDAYVLVNFEVFLTVVDRLAPQGVEVCIDEPIYDPDYPDEGYGFIEVRFDPGCQRLNTERLLQYARTRATDGADFDRARRQQQVIKAVQAELVSAGGARRFIAQAPQLWADISDNMSTDLTFERAMQLAVVASGISSDDITTGVIDNLYVEFSVNAAGEQILIPYPGAIASLVQQTFNPEQDLTLDDLRTRAANERASIVVLNNTQTTGLAGQTQAWLSERGVTATTGNVSAPNNANTVIRDYTGNIWTARLLAEMLGLPQDRILPGDGETGADVAVIVGPDITALTGS